MICEFWLKILPPAFASMLAELLRGIKGKIGANILDDILTYSQDFDQHLILIDAVFTLLQSAGLSVNFAKSKRCCPSLEFVGMVVERQGVRPARTKVAAVAELPPPSTRHEGLFAAVP